MLDAHVRSYLEAKPRLLRLRLKLPPCLDLMNKILVEGRVLTVNTRSSNK